MEGFLAMDGGFLLWIQNNLRNPVLDPFFRTITHLGDGGMIWILLTLALLIMPKTRRIGFYSVCALICSTVVNSLILKNLVARTRPYEILEGLEILISRPFGFSFPSGHSATAFACTASVCMTVPDKKYRVWTVLLMVLAALIAFSRLYVGVHFPTDVICGAVSGILCSLLGVRIGKKLLKTPLIARIVS